MRGGGGRGWGISQGMVCLKKCAKSAKTGCGKSRDRTGKTYPFDKLPRQAGAGRAGSQGLKPDVSSIIYGPTKVVP
jgi:hypothetical protein